MSTSGFLNVALGLAGSHVGALKSHLRFFGRGLEVIGEAGGFGFRSRSEWYGRKFTGASQGICYRFMAETEGVLRLPAQPSGGVGCQDVNFKSILSQDWEASLAGCRCARCGLLPVHHDLGCSLWGCWGVARSDFRMGRCVVPDFG